MIIKTKFNIYQVVGIIALENHKGTVVEIKLDGKNLYYRVEYWWN